MIDDGIESNFDQKDRKYAAIDFSHQAKKGVVRDSYCLSAVNSLLQKLWLLK